MPARPGNTTMTDSKKKHRDPAGANEEKKRLEDAVRELREKLGTASTFDEIVKASDYCARIDTSTEDHAGAKIWNQYVAKLPEQDRFWNEISMYRLIGQTSHFLLPDEKIDVDTLNELVCALEIWVFLIITEKLHVLLQHPSYSGVRALKKNGASPAEVFRAYMNVHKAKSRFEKWTKKNMNDMRFDIYKVVVEVRQGDQPRATASFKQESLPRANDDHVRDETEDLYGASPQSAARSNVPLSFPRSQSAQSAPQTISSTSSSPLMQERSETQTSPINSRQTNNELSCFQGVFTKIRKFETKLKALELKVTEKQMVVKEIEEAAEKAKIRFRTVGREAQQAELDCPEPEDWTPEELERQADEIEKVAKLKREALRAISDLLEKKKTSKAELLEVETEARKYRDWMQRLVGLAQELDEE